jgi:spore coat protein U-like protein
MKKSILLVIFLSIFPVQIFAASSNTTFLVQAVVKPTCSITALPLIFGQYHPTDTKDKNTNETTSTNAGFIYATCVNGTPYTLTLNAGLYPSTPNNVNTRNMKGGMHGALLPYRIYPTIQLSGPQWGDGDNGSTVVSTRATGIQQTIAAYGVVSPYQTKLPSDTYTDTITVSVLY